MSTQVRDNPGESRYEIHEDGRLAAFTAYELRGSLIDFVHTETQAGFEGRGLARALVQQTLDDVRRRGLHVRPFCPYVRAFIAKNPEYRDLVRDEDLARFDLAS
jgi:predicted GNAT family acetyltransferase